MVFVKIKTIGKKKKSRNMCFGNKWKKGINKGFMEWEKKEERDRRLVFLEKYCLLENDTWTQGSFLFLVLSFFLI